MKKLTLFLLVLVIFIMGAFLMLEPASASKADQAMVRTMDAVLSSEKGSVVGASHFEKAIAVKGFSPLPVPDSKANLVAETPIEQSHGRDDIPLVYEEQEWLRAACEEFGVPYALALGLIENETTFQNITGDNGASAGYMQIQQKWHWDRMARLEVTNLLDPYGNFRVGCDFLSELYGRYQDWSMALTVYNMGHYPGYITDYANTVMANYARWQALIETTN